MIKRTAIYSRVSTGAQEREGTSLTSQEERCRLHASEQGYSVDEANVYREAHTGAELWERPKLTALREAVKRGEVEAVIVYAVDRLSRKQTQLATIIGEFEDRGVLVRFVTEEFEQTSVGTFLRGVKAFVAELEREKIVERTTRGKLTRLKSGKVNNYGFEMYGYRRDRDAGVRYIEEAEAAVVRRIFRASAEEGRSLRKIAAELDLEGVRTPSEGKVRRQIAVPHRWTHGSIRHILMNPAYRGESIAWYVKRVKRRNEDGTVSWINQRRPEEDCIRLATPPIVTEDLWHRAQQRLGTNTSANSRLNQREYLLTGMVYCRGCGKRLRTRIRKGKRIYTCSSADRQGESCGARQISIDWLEWHVWERIRETVKDPDRLAAARLLRRKFGPDPALLARLEDARRVLGQVIQRQDRLIDLYADGGRVPLDVVKQQLEDAQAKRHIIEGDIDEIKSKLSDGAAIGASFEDFASYCTRVSREFDGMSTKERHQFLKRLNIRIQVRGRSVQIYGVFTRLDGYSPRVYSSTPTFAPEDLMDPDEVAHLFSDSRSSIAGAGRSASGRTFAAR